MHCASSPTTHGFRCTEATRSMAAARRFSDDVPDEVKSERLMRLQEVQRSISLLIHRSYVGKTFDVLVDDKAKRGEARISGRTRTNKVVIFDGPQGWVGKTVPVRIVGFSSHSLFGESRVESN